MIHEFAVDPGCLTSWERVKLVTEACGSHLGRYISEFPSRRWPIWVQSQFTNFRDRQTVLELLGRLQHRGGLRDAKRSYAGKLDHFNESEWMESALREHSRRPFRAIVCENQDETHPAQIALRSLDPHDGLWHVSTENKIPRTAAALLAWIEPLLQFSQELLLIDPYFHPDTPRYCAAVEEYLRLTAREPRRFSE